MTQEEQRERARRWMMAQLDGELGATDREALERLLEADESLRAEWEKMRRVKEVTDTMSYREPPEEVWGTYWESVYNKLERGFGWILMSIGILILFGYGLWEWVTVLLQESDLPGFVRLALFATLFGGTILLVSVIREKWFTHRRDPYKEIQR